MPLRYPSICAYSHLAHAQGLPTTAQLLDGFQDVARSARTLAMLPQERFGPLSVGLSKLAAKLKVRCKHSDLVCLLSNRLRGLALSISASVRCMSDMDVAQDASLSLLLKVDERSAVKAGLTAEEAGVSHSADSALAQVSSKLNSCPL